MNLLFWLCMLGWAAASFDPTTRDVRVSLLMRNVVVDAGGRPTHLEYADFTKRFRKDIPKLGYIVGVDQHQLERLDHPPAALEVPEVVDKFSLGAIFAYYSNVKSKLAAHWDTVQASLSRHDTFSVYLMENSAESLLLVVSSQLPGETYEVIEWFNSHVGSNQGKAKWCGTYDPWNKIRVVRLGEDPWFKC